MPAGIAAVICTIVIAGLFWLDRDERTRTSRALWLPLVWLALAGSRSVSQWLSMGPILDSPGQLLEGSPIDRLVYSALLAGGLLVVVSRRRQVGSLLRANGPVLVFFLYSAVSILWSDYPDVAFKRWTKAVGDLIMVLIVLSDRDPLTAVKRLLSRNAYVLIPLSILFIKYYPNLGRGYGRWDGTTYYVGVTTNKNSLGMICLIFGLGAAWRLLIAFQNRNGKYRTRHLIAQGAILAMVLWILLIANSMSSLAGFLLGTALLLATSFREIVRRPAVVHLLVGGMLTLAGSALFLDLGLLQTIGRDPTLTDRMEVWSLAVSLVTNPLLGTGFESFWLGSRLEKMWSVYSWQPGEAHNGYLEVFLNLGLMGVGLLAVVLVIGYRTVIAACRRDPPPGNLGLAYFAVGLVYNFTEAAFFRMMAPVWILFLLAITELPERPSSKVRASASTWRPHRYRTDLPASKANSASRIQSRSTRERIIGVLRVRNV